MAKIQVSETVKLNLYTLMRKTRATEDRIVSLYRQGHIVGGVYTSR